MCEYQFYDNTNPLPMCEFTKKLCTLCVLGNSKTYNEAEKAEKQVKYKRFTKS